MGLIPHGGALAQVRMKISLHLHKGDRKVWPVVRKGKARNTRGKLGSIYGVPVVGVVQPWPGSTREPLGKSFSSSPLLQTGGGAINLVNPLDRQKAIFLETAP